MNIKRIFIIECFVVGLIILNIFFCANYDKDLLVNNHKIINSAGESYVQKGPFIGGSLITIQELNEHCLPNGRSFVLQVENNLGMFRIQESFSSALIECIAEGCYFHEIKNQITKSPLILRSLGTPYDSLHLKINILTTLSTNRIKHLISNNHLSYFDATQQAENEIFSFFKINEPKHKSFNQMNIVHDNILLGLSLLIQGNLEVSDLSLFIQKITSDFETDGVINDSTIVTQLNENYSSIFSCPVRNNLESYYSNSGVKCDFSDFHKYWALLFDFNVTSIVPSHNLEKIPCHQSIQVTFNKSLNMDHWQNNHIQILKGESIISSTITFDSLCQQVTLNPDSLFEYAIQYQIKISSEIEAVDGSKLSKNISTTFSTLSEAQLLVSQSPIQFVNCDTCIHLPIQNIGDDSLFWEALADQNWLTLSSNAGILANDVDTLVLSINQNMLEPGEHATTLRISSNGGSAKIPIQVIIPNQPVLSVNPSVLNFGYDEQTLTFAIQNNDKGVLNWSIILPDSHWSASKVSGNTEISDLIELTFERQGIAPGNYVDTLYVQSNGGDSFCVLAYSKWQKIIDRQPNPEKGKDAVVWSLPCETIYAIEHGVCQETNFSDLYKIGICNYTYWGDTASYRTYIQFNVPELTEEAIIDSAFLVFSIIEDDSSAPEGDFDFKVSRVLSEWNESTINWINKPDVALGNIYSDQIFVSSFNTSVNKLKIRCDEMISYWLEKPNENFGFCLSLVEEINRKRLFFYSSDYSNSDKHPQLLIYYSHP